MNRSQTLMSRPNPWIALHRTSLGHHLEQCVPRGMGPAFDRCVDAIHSMLSSRFLTTVCGVSALLLVPIAWFG
jgi:hypothetical protein